VFTSIIIHVCENVNVFTYPSAIEELGHLRSVLWGRGQQVTSRRPGRGLARPEGQMDGWGGRRVVTPWRPNVRLGEGS
jgi:hypothetical protein